MNQRQKRVRSVGIVLSIMMAAFSTLAVELAPASAMPSDHWLQKKPGQTQAQRLFDEQVGAVDAFFESFACTRPNHSTDYVNAARLYEIDYRILPAISVIESTCGAYQQGNNHWGWNSARTGFESVPRGIYYVARQLAEGRPYRGRNTEAKLQSYNPKEEYVRLAIRLMDQMSEPESSVAEQSFTPTEVASALTVE